ncbi:putative quinol monooxygenase [Curtobacterium pusillum]|uniref:putative quinol monooxygenase n=1 Tax=Curtobacterium pusillum TaxID=69373 RepID=UPI0037F2DBAD
MNAPGGTGPTGPFVITSQLQAGPGQQDDLIALLRELAESIHAEPECTHYSIHRAIGDTIGPLTVVQVYATAEAFRLHQQWMRTRVPALAALLAGPPSPPVLLEQVILSGHERERVGP